MHFLSRGKCAYINLKCIVDYLTLNKFEVTANNVDRKTERQKREMKRNSMGFWPASKRRKCGGQRERRE